MFARRSIRLRLTLWYFLLLAVILAAFSAGVYLTLRHNLSVNLNNSLNNRGELLLEVIRYEDGRPTLAGVVSPAGPDGGEQFVRVFDESGAATFSNREETADVRIDAAAVDRALAGETVKGNNTVGGEPMRTRTFPIVRDGSIDGALEVGLSEDDLGDTLQTLLIILAIAYPATLAAASFGGIFLANRALSPIDRITRLARRISADDLSQRVDLSHSRDEVGRLASTFNEMIERLDAGFQRQRQFTADASHEMRTPLTAIKGEVEVALSRDREPDAYRDVLRNVNEEIDRLIRLVGSLLMLARADAGEIPIETESTNLGALVAAAVSQVQPTAEQAEITVSIDAGPDVTLQADEDLLLQLLLNLIDNALKYAPPASEVIVGWGAEHGRATLWVRDAGSGIAAEDHERIFDRFYRVDKARSHADAIRSRADNTRSRAGGGTGLGLSISRWIARAHGGEISVESSPGAGATFTVTLPRTPASPQA